MNSKKTCFPHKIGSVSCKISLLTLLAFALLLSPMVVYGATVTLAWDANTEPDLAGYKIYYRTPSGVFNSDDSVNVKEDSSGWSSGCGPVYDPFKTECCEYTLKDLEENETYYLAAKAYDIDGNESAYSEELVHITEDATLPTVTITTPTSGSTYSTSQSQLSIGGTASDNKAVSTVSWTTSLGGSGTCSGTSSWSKSGIALSSGQNVITVTATDAAGNTATDTLTVTYSPPDTTPPTVTITTPTSGSTYSTSQSQLSIGGTASDNKAVSTVSWSNSLGGSGTCSGTSSWSKSGIALSSGQNVITVTATDAAGNTATDTLTVTYSPPDTTPPTVTITTPTSGSTYSTSQSQLSIGGTASDNKAVSTVSWTTSLGGSGTCSGTSSWSKSGIALSSGQNVITVTATDAAGNTATDTLTVTYSPPDTTPPTVTITTPTSGSTYSTSQSQLSISGTASDNVAITLVSWSNSLGGSGTCSGTSSWSKSGIALSSGQNVITVTATDAAGNTATDTLTVTYSPPDTTPPTVTITTPTSGSTYSTSQSQLSIGGTASDNKAVSTVSWTTSLGGSGTCSGTSSWSKSGIALSSGQNVITVTATDAAGNTATDTLTVTYSPPDTTPPTVTITTPTSGSTYSTSQSQLSIGGTASDNKAVSTVSWTTSLGGSGTCSGTSSWSKSGIALSSGQNVITVTATDAAGNTATDTLTVTYSPPDTTPPTVTITTPTSGSTYSTSQSQLSIGGTASDNVAITLVSWSNSLGGSGTCSGTSSWSKSGIALSSGQNVITVTATDAAGNTATDTLTVTYSPPDTTPPTVTITTPTSGSTYSTSQSQLSIGGTASDNKAVSTVSWSNSLGGSGTCSGTSSWSKSGIALSSGQNVITVTATDAAGNTVTDTLTVTYTPPDTTPPTVTITTPTSGSTYSTSQSQLSIGGTASDNKAVSTVSWTTSLGGSGTCSGTSSWSKSGIALSSGQNVITVTATDAAGNTVTDTLTVTYTPPDTTPPIEAEDMPIKTTGVPISGGWNIWDNGYIADNIDFAAGGTVSFEVMAMGSYAGGAWPIMEVRIDQTPVGTVTVDSSSWTAYTIQASITPGTHEVAIAFINDYWEDPDDRNLYVDKVTITTENSAPVSNAGDDQTVEEGETVTLSGLNSTDPDDNIANYTWQQTGGKSVTLSNSKGAETTFIAPNAVTDADTLTFSLTVKDTEKLQDLDDCIVTVTRVAVVDSDGDGVPNDQDAFPNDPNEYLDTDGDGQGNNADTDDDNDGMPDTWEVTYGLDPLKDDAADDPDGDEISNINEYNLGSDPNYNESNFAPDPPQLLNIGNDEIVGLTPLLETGEFYDPDINDVHSQTRWNIIRAEDDFIVFDVTTNSSLTVLQVPKLILEEGTDYIWQVKFIDNQGTASEWSEAGYFTTKFLEQDSDGNGVLDFQEVDTTIDLDKDGIMDRDQEDIKCVATETGDFKVGISIREAENADSIVSIQSETPSDTDLLLSAQDGLNFLAFGLIHFKLLVKEPGDEVLVTIYLSKAAYDDGIWYKYDPVNDEWFDYSDFIDFSADRKTVHLTLTDGGFGDADGIENGVIVDPLALRTATDHSSGSDSFVEDVVDNLDPSGMCFISAADSRSADRQPLSLWREIRSRELLIVFVLMMLAYIGKEIFLRIKQYRRPGRKTSLMEGWRNS